MQFGKVPNPEEIDFTLPKDHPDTKQVLEKSASNSFKIHVGCAKWNKQDLKGFYPKGTKDELAYYSKQFNSIELNATFYRIFPPEQFNKWYDKTPKDFKFFPKLVQNISHFKRLNEESRFFVDNYLSKVIHLKDKLGTIFLQMHSNFSPKDFNRVIDFVEKWPKEISLAIELRHTDWYNNSAIAKELYQLFEANNISNIITDTAGRRDLLHMRLTNSEAFIRYVGANHKSDYSRLDVWIERIKQWKDQGIQKVGFFIHQNSEVESPLLAAHFITKLNSALHTDLKIPYNPNTNNKDQTSLF